MIKAFRSVIRAGLLIGIAVRYPAWPATAQTPPLKEAQPAAPAVGGLTGDHAKKAEELDKAIDAALKADRWDEAIARADELLVLRARSRGRSTSKR